MTAGQWIALISAAGSLLGGGGWFVARATVKASRATALAMETAARLQAGPARTEASLAVLQATVERVDVENGRLRSRQSRLEALVRAFAWYVSELTVQMRAHGLEPAVAPDEVAEYMRTGV